MNTWIYLYGQANFNPTMVWFLQVSVIVCVVLLMVYFNPTMVWFLQERRGGRLKTIRSISIPPWSDFYTRHKNSSPLFSSNISIPPWSDFYLNVTSAFGLLLTTFQSHHGLISTFRSSCLVVVVNINFNPTMVWFLLFKRYSSRCWRLYISIPPWSDFYWSGYIAIGVMPSWFQSHHGLISTSHSRYHSW